ncbi:MAG: hypothetical protein WDW36_007990 [Sanguina aurantia]
MGRTPVTICLHNTGLVRVNNFMLGRLEQSCVRSEHNNAVGPSYPAGLPVEPLSAMLFLLVAHTPEGATPPWKRSLLQTALLLRLTTFPADACISSVAKGLGSEWARLLRRELCEGIEAAMAAATAAGKPVDVVQLMAWLEPPAYRPFEPCPEHMASMAQLPIPRWVMSAVVATESPSTASADLPGRLELLSVAVMWDAPSPALQAVLQGKGPAGRRLALEMQQADKASKTLLSQVAGHRSLSSQQARQAVNNQEISFTR